MPVMRIIHHYSVYWVLLFTALHIGVHGYILMHQFNVFQRIHTLPTFVKTILALRLLVMAPMHFGTKRSTCIYSSKYRIRTLISTSHLVNSS